MDITHYATRAIFTTLRSTTPVNSEARKRYLEFEDWFVNSAGTDEDPYGADDGLTENPGDRRTIVSVISDAVGKDWDKYCNGDRDEWVSAIEKTLYEDPAYRHELVINVLRDVMVESIVRRYLYALTGTNGRE